MTGGHRLSPSPSPLVGSTEGRDHLPGEESETLGAGVAPEADDEARYPPLHALAQPRDDLVGRARGTELRGAGQEADLLVHLLGPPPRLVAGETDGAHRLLRDLDLVEAPADPLAVSAQHLELRADLAMEGAEVVPDVGVAGHEPEQDLLAGAADEDGGMRLAGRPRAAAGVLDVVVRAVEGRQLLGPHPFQDLEP